MLLTGDVSVGSRGGTLLINGDAASNSINIAGLAGGGYQISGLAGTKVNGLASFTTDNLVRPIKITLGAGDDAITFRAATFGSGLSIDAGEGNDIVYATRSTFSAVDVFAVGGNDNIGFADSTFARRLRINGGDGRDAIGIVGTRARRGFEIADGGTGSRTQLDKLNSSGESWVATGGGNDRIDITDGTFAALSVKLRAGNDSVRVRGTQFTTSSPIDAGDGVNVVDREVIVATDYAAGAGGWQRLSTTGNPATDLQVEFGTYSDSLIPRRTSVVFPFAAGDGIGLKRPLTLSDGLLPNTVYEVRADIRYGTEIGIGGQFADLFAGAVPVNPLTGWTRETDEEEGLITSAGVEYRTNSLGRFTTIPQSDSTGQGRLYRQQTTGSAPRVTTDGNGRAWAVYSEFGVGIDLDFDVHFLTTTFKFTPVLD